MTAYQQAMRAPGRELAVSGKMTLHTGREIALTGADVISLNIDEGVNDGLLVGAVLSAKHTLKLAGAGGAWLPGGDKLSSDAVLGATVQLSIGTARLSSRCARSWCARPRRKNTEPELRFPVTTACMRKRAERFPIRCLSGHAHGGGAPHCRQDALRVAGQRAGGSAQIPAKPQWGTCNVRRRWAGRWR